MFWFLTVFFFILGTIVGSFLNSLTFRYNTGYSILTRSRCFSCGHKLSVLELIPILSFILLSGRCRECHNRISIVYPLVEFITGIIFTLIFIKLYPQFLSISFSPLITSLVYSLFFYFAIFSILFAIVIYDVRHKIIPDGFVFLFITFSLLNIFFSTCLNGCNQESLLARKWDIFAGPILFTPLVLMWALSSGRWMGFGDAKLTLGIGWFLGLTLGLTAITLGFWIGAVIGLFGLFLNKIPLIRRLNTMHNFITINREIPFAPFLVLGALIVFLTDLNLFNLIPSG